MRRRHGPPSLPQHPTHPSTNYHQTNHIIYCGAPLNAKHQRKRRNQAQPRTKNCRHHEYDRNASKPPDNPRNNHRHNRASKGRQALEAAPRPGTADDAQARIARSQAGNLAQTRQQGTAKVQNSPLPFFAL